MLQSNLQQQSRNILNANQFNCVRKIGKGGFGHVLLATKATSSSTFYAIKCLSRKKMIRDPALRKSLAQEINTMAAVEHPNIVKLYKTFEEGDWYFLVMEYCDMGNLLTMQSKLPNRVFSLEEAINIFGQLIRGVEAIHKLNIVHRDIKPENVFVRKTDKNALVCKIGDFGLARFLEVSANSNCGTQNYMAPQILEQVPYGKEVDVWSLGVLLYYLLFGDFPFKGINVLDDILSKCNGGFKLYQHKGKGCFRTKKQEALLNDLFARTFQPEPRQRICIADLKYHPALKIRPIQQDPSTEEEAVSQHGVAVQWEVNQMRFVQKISKQIQQQGFMQASLLLGFKFYINKVLLYLINKELIRNYRKDKEGHPKLLKLLKEMEGDFGIKLERLLAQLKETRQGREVRENIAQFEDGMSTKYQDFSKFKVGYRNTIGKVYEEVHRKYPQNTQERAGLKLKVFLCHIINRVFSGPFNPSLFPHFAVWNKKSRGKSPKSYDFRSLQDWMEQESTENLNASQEVINKTFYK